ncbi:hypothetical protein [Tautonia sociabilis]|uniref:Uncharacterized protein n=1 Tax=Tautonia sociabilis TaxID=2080755 RepID=A0A432MJ61_9BACT|nr:hypothetical protein [Tautonia sociabilis]RUL87414.1 hypothetical protein TsocGM_12085 [Tautonia sociabilis]
MARSRPSDPTPEPPASPSPRRARTDMAPTPPVAAPKGNEEVNVAVAASAESGGGTITARKAGGLRDVGMNVDPLIVGLPAALQHLAKGVNIAFQTDYGENFLEAVYQAAVVFDDEIRIVHKEYFGFGQSWFSQFGKLVRSMQLTFDGPDPASPEGQRRIREHGPATLRGILNLIGRKLDLVAEYEDRVPAYVEQMFDRLEASGIIDGWNREDWRIRTTRIGLDIRITPSEHVLDELAARAKAEAEARRAEAEARRAEAEAKRAEARALTVQARSNDEEQRPRPKRSSKPTPKSKSKPKGK